MSIFYPTITLTLTAMADKFVIWFAGDFMFKGKIVSETPDRLQLEVHYSLNFPGIKSSWSTSGFCWIPKTAVRWGKDGFADLVEGFKIGPTTEPG